jgi:hypothetical protein
MAYQEPPLPRCTHYDTPGDEATRCPLVATYIVLGPPVTLHLMPTPVFLNSERRTRRLIAHRPQPLYCRQHAYGLCGMPCPTAATTPYALSAILGEGPYP